MPGFTNRLLFVLPRLSAALLALALSFGVHAADSLSIAATGTAMPMLKILIDDFARQSPVAGVRPSLRSLQDGTYPYQRTLYLVSQPRLRDHPFIAYLRSARANRLLEANGFVKTVP